MEMARPAAISHIRSIPGWECLLHRKRSNSMFSESPENVWFRRKRNGYSRPLVCTHAPHAFRRLMTYTLHSKPWHCRDHRRGSVRFDYKITILQNRKSRFFNQKSRFFDRKSRFFNQKSRFFNQKSRFFNRKRTWIAPPYRCHYKRSRLSQKNMFQKLKNILKSIFEMNHFAMPKPCRRLLVFLRRSHLPSRHPPAKFILLNTQFLVFETEFLAFDTKFLVYNAKFIIFTHVAIHRCAFLCLL